jgi:hypothetical protein
MFLYFLFMYSISGTCCMYYLLFTITVTVFTIWVHFFRILNQAIRTQTEHVRGGGSFLFYVDGERGAF